MAWMSNAGGIEHAGVSVIEDFVLEVATISSGIKKPYSQSCIKSSNVLFYCFLTLDRLSDGPLLALLLKTGCKVDVRGSGTRSNPPK